MQQTGYDVSAVMDPAVTRKILLDGLRRPAVAVRPFAESPSARHTDPVADPAEDLILVDLGRGPEHADLLGALRDGGSAPASGRDRQETDQA